MSVYFAAGIGFYYLLDRFADRFYWKRIVISHDILSFQLTCMFPTKLATTAEEACSYYSYNIKRVLDRYMNTQGQHLTLKLEKKD